MYGVVSLAFPEQLRGVRRLDLQRFSGVAVGLLVACVVALWLSGQGVRIPLKFGGLS